MIKFEIKNRQTGKKEAYEKEDISLMEAERFYELQDKQEKENEKAKKKAIEEIEKEHGSENDFENKDFYFQLVQQKYLQIVDAKKLRQMEREYFVSLFADQGLTEDDILQSMSTKVYNKISKEIFREISGEDEESNQDESEELGKNGEQSQ